MKVKYWMGMVVVCTLISGGLAFAQRVRLAEGTVVRVRLKADLASERVEAGERVDFEVVGPVVIQGMTVIPVGAVSWGAVQSVKKGKFVKFDIEGVRLPDLTDIKLRSAAARAKSPVQDQIKADSSFRGGVGAPKGTEYTAYVNEDREVAVGGQPAGSPTLPAVPAAAPAAPASSPNPSGAPPAKTERVMVQCFSDPSGADILIDGDFYGNTPSILKLPVGKHELEIQLSGYKTYSIPLILQSDTAIRTIHPTLEPKE